MQSSLSGSSHRGVDLGPLRLNMPGGLLRRQDGPGGRSSLATASLAARYGSGARLPSRERDRAGGTSRGRSARATVFDATNTTADPAGPQTAQDWLDALNSFTHRLDTVERHVRDHSALIAKTDERLIENHSRANDMSGKIEAVITKADANAKHLEEACRNINSKFALSSDVELAIGQVLEQVNNLNLEFQALSNLVATGPTPIPINTPDRRPSPPGMDQHRQDDQTAGAYSSGPGNMPMWNSRLPQPAIPHQNMAAAPPAFPLTQVMTASRSSPLRNQDEPYVAPPQPHHATAPAHSGLNDQAGCPPQTPPQGMPSSWAQAPGAPTPPWSQAQHRQASYPQYHQQHGHPQQAMPPRPDFQGGNRVQYMGNREAMDKKSEALKKFTGNATDFPN